MNPTGLMGDLPVVMVVKVVRRGAVRAVKVQCCWCPAMHWHGWPTEHAHVGVRLAHCVRRDSAPVRSYYVHVDVPCGVR
jgi:hypothetical protein